MHFLPFLNSVNFVHWVSLPIVLRVLGSLFPCQRQRIDLQSYLRMCASAFPSSFFFSILRIFMSGGPFSGHSMLKIIIRHEPNTHSSSFNEKKCKIQIRDASHPLHTVRRYMNYLQNYLEPKLHCCTIYSLFLLLSSDMKLSSYIPLDAQTPHPVGRSGSARDRKV